jgi:enamine deaminase RidA (YjgF/YER057c/UK114 family)
LTSNNSHIHFFLKGFNAADSLSAKEQTENVLNKISLFCKSRGIPYRNIVRTWIYLREIDRDYMDMVECRRKVFSNWGLSEKDRFPASTGIGGRNKNPKALVLMDAIIIDGIKDGQIQRMEAVSRMSHAMSYGVTFERGLKVRYGDRDHLYISGTASIDTNGDVIHRADIIKQTEHTLENIRVLLGKSSSSMDELVYLLVYIKDPADAILIDSYLKANLPEHIPFILLQADICRQEWLIEIEGMAISKSDHQQYNDF